MSYSMSMQHYPTTIDLGILLNMATQLRDADLMVQARGGTEPAQVRSGTSGGRGGFMGEMTKTWSRLTSGLSVMGPRSSSHDTDQKS